MKSNNDLKKYIKNVKKEFPYIRKNEKDFLFNLEKNIMTNENCSFEYKHLIKEYGSPSEIASTYFENNIDYPYHKYQRIKIIIYILVIALLISFIFAIWQAKKMSEKSYINREIIEIHEDE